MAHLQELLALQNDDGSYDLNSKFSETIGVDLGKIQSGGAIFAWAENIWATAVVLGYFIEKAGDQKSTWERADEKGRSWLEAHVGSRVPEDTVEFVLETGKNFVYNILVNENPHPSAYRPLVNKNK